MLSHIYKYKVDFQINIPKVETISEKQFIIILTTVYKVMARESTDTFWKNNLCLRKTQVMYDTQVQLIIYI